MSEARALSEVVAQLKKLASDEAAPDADLVEAFRSDVLQVLDFLEKSLEVAEKAKGLLENAYSLPDDGRGIRIQSEDAVKLQWALRAIGIGDDSGEPCFTV